MSKRLPAVGEGMILANGTIIEASAPPQAQTRISVPTNTNAQRVVASTQRKLLEMPAMPKQMNGVAVILVYTVSGLSTGEIAIATGLTHEQINTIREGTVYQQLEQYMVAAVKEQTAATVQDILGNAEVSAATRLSELVNSNDERVAAVAVKDLLDRRGHTGKQVTDARTAMMGTLRIEVVDKRDMQGMPVIDVEVEP